MSFESSSLGRNYRTPAQLNYANHPPNISYGSLSDNGSRNVPYRAPAPPPRNYNYNSQYSNYNSSYPNYNSPYSSPYSYGYNGYSSNFNRPIYNARYSPMYRQNYISSQTGYSPYEPGFLEEAQEQSRDAFAGIESIVNTFGSINMMIESTYCALHSSFDAVLSVAENFSRLKFQFGQVLSAFTLVRGFLWLYRKLLYLLGLRKIDPTTERAWKVAEKSLEASVGDNASKKSSWPVIAFFIAVYAGPFLMWKFINSIMKKRTMKEDWENENGDSYYAIAKYNYTAQSPDELSFSVGECLKLAPYEKQKSKSWPLASDGKRTGFIPINYVDIKLKNSNKNVGLTPHASKNGIPNAFAKENELHNVSIHNTDNFASSEIEENLNHPKSIALGSDLDRRPFFHARTVNPQQRTENSTRSKDEDVNSIHTDRKEFSRQGDGSTILQSSEFEEAYKTIAGNDSALTERNVVNDSDENAPQKDPESVRFDFVNDSSEPSVHEFVKHSNNDRKSDESVGMHALEQGINDDIKSCLEGELETLNVEKS